MSSLALSSLGKRRLLIFDFDGTLADTSPLHAQAFVQTLAPLDITVDYSRIAGLKTKDAMELSLDESGVYYTSQDIDDLVAKKQTLVRQLIDTSLEPLSGVDAVLRIAHRHFRLAIVSSGSRGTVGSALKKLGYFDWFELIVCAEDVSLGKPSPEGFNLAVQNLSVKSEETIIFEDSSAGIAAAEAATIDVVDVTKTPWSSIMEELMAFEVSREGSGL